MKNFKLVLATLVLLGSTGIASADEIVYGNPGPQVSASVAFPGFRLVLGRPGQYCWYGGRYYTRAAWDRFYRLHRDRDRDRLAYGYRGHDRDDSRRFNGDRDNNRHFDNDRDRDLHRN